AVGGDILGQGQLEDRAADQLVRRVAQERGQVGIDALQPPVGVHLGNADAGLLVGGGQTLTLCAQLLCAAVLGRTGGGERERGNSTIPHGRELFHAHYSLFPLPAPRVPGEEDAYITTRQMRSSP